MLKCMLRFCVGFCLVLERYLLFLRRLSVSTGVGEFFIQILTESGMNDHGAVKSKKTPRLLNLNILDFGFYWLLFVSWS
jgi:hypothetical protein